MLQSLIKKQLAADFPDQAADLQALQDVSSSVSTNSGLLRQGARAAPPFMSSKPRSLDIELPEWMQIGKAMLPALEKLMFGNWDRIDETHELKDGRKVTIAGYGHENKASRTITIEDINGQTMVLTGEQILGSDDGTQTPLLALKGGTVNGRKLSENELQSFSEALTFAGVKTVLNSDVNEDGDDGTEKPPETDDKTQTQNSPIVSEDGAILPPNGPEQPDPEDQDPKGLVPIKPPNRSANPKDVGQQPSSDLKLPKSSNEEEKKRRMEAGKVAAEKYLNSHEPFRAKKKVPRVRPDVEPSENPALYDQLDVKVFEHFDGVTSNAPGEGSMSGTPDGFSDGMKDYQITQRVREQDSAFVLKEAGYTVEYQPLVRTEDDLRVGANPDYRINGKIYDCYAPTRGSARNIWSHIMNEKIGTRQTKRVVLNLRDTPVTVFEMIQQFEAAGSPGLLDLIIIK